MGWLVAAANATETVLKPLVIFSKTATTQPALPMWLLVIFATLLVIMSGLFSGLNLGLMALDKTNLEIIKAVGSEREKKQARMVEPVRRRGNMLLCTLLLGNVMVNVLITQVTDQIGGGTVAFIVSTALIVVFGEIIPQAICTRHGLAVGAYTAWIVWIVMILMFVIAFPMSLVLDCVLGHEIGTIYTKTQMKELLQYHATHEKSDINTEEAQWLTGALEFSQRHVDSVMTPLEHVYMLDMTDVLNFETMSQILESGHSRIPIYEGPKTHLIGFLVVKDLILLDPEDETPVHTAFSFFGRQAIELFPDLPLNQVFQEFKSGRSHMAVVTTVNNETDGDPFYEAVGIVTMEDVLEALIQDEIVDESDVYVQIEKKNLVPRLGGVESKPIPTEILTRKRWVRASLRQETIGAVCSFIRERARCFDCISDRVLAKLVQSATVVEIDPQNTSAGRVDPLVVRAGAHNPDFVIVLQGKLSIFPGEMPEATCTSTTSASAEGGAGVSVSHSDSTASLIHHNPLSAVDPAPPHLADTLAGCVPVERMGKWKYLNEETLCPDPDAVFIAQQSVLAQQHVRLFLVPRPLFLSSLRATELERTMGAAHHSHSSNGSGPAAPAYLAPAGEGDGEIPIVPASQGAPSEPHLEPDPGPKECEPSVAEKEALANSKQGVL